MDGTQPRISVIVSNHDYGRFLLQAIASVTAQLGPEDELIVVDDGSTDESREILSSLTGDPRLRIVLQPNTGSFAALATGLGIACNQIVAFLDADDWYLDGHLDRVRTLFREHPDIEFGFARGQIHAVRGSDLRASAAMLRLMEYPPGPVGSTALVAALAWDWVGSPTSGLVMHRELAKALFERVGVSTPGLEMFPDAVLVRGADLHGARKYALAQPGYAYRIHGTNHHRSLGAPLARWRQRRERARTIRDRFADGKGPTTSRLCGADGLKDEVMRRAWPCRAPARLRLAAAYLFMALWRCDGPVRQRLALVMEIGRRMTGGDPRRP